MTSKLLIITGLGIGYYLFVKASHKEVKYLPEKFAGRKQIIPKKTLSISTVVNKPIITPKDILTLETSIIPSDILRASAMGSSKVSSMDALILMQEQKRIAIAEAAAAKEKKLSDIISRSKIIAETSTDTVYAEMAARFVAQEAAKVASKARALAIVAAQKVAAAAKALKEKRLEDMINRSKIIAADTTQIIDYRSDAAKFIHQEKRRAEGWTKAEWQKEWRDMLNV